MDMQKHRVLLICLQPLLSEGLERIFQKLDEVELIQFQCADFDAIEQYLTDQKPQVVVIAGQDEDDFSDHLIASLLKRCRDVPIVWIGIENNVMRVYTARTVPASSNQLIAAIHQAAILNDEPTKTDGGEGDVHPQI